MIVKNPTFYQMGYPFAINAAELTQKFAVVRCELDDAPYGGTCYIEGKNVTISMPEEKVGLVLSHNESNSLGR